MQAAGSIQQFNNPRDLLQQSHFPSIDGLRAISIIMVLIRHVTVDTNLDKYFNGGIGVEIFFVISGFLITTLLLKEKEKYGTISLKKFYIRRILRIVPVAFLFVMVLIALNYMFALGISRNSFIMSLLYIKNMPIKSGQMDWYSGHFWSLSVEEQFYIFFPACIMLSINKTKIWITILVAAIPLISYVAFLNLPFFANRVVHTVTFIFINMLGQGTAAILTGCLLSILLFKGYFKKLPSGKWTTLILFIAALAIHSIPYSTFWSYVCVMIFDFLIGFVIILNLNPDNYFARFLNTPIMVKLGILSYSLYIWQQIFTHNQPWAHLFKYADSPLINLPALFIVAYVSYYFYEKKFLRLKDRFVRA
ncbi:acyltransferase [Mucilaginibacter sp. HMF5004]|uniref:acyltransferase family protein n=1 Tax=Mucilaginibacter rivuli TaxID=2857527 RepID=UPI001C6018DC|nr:acyltransferase [Mucilaginibacter rivuli]MBW4889840.1 acyltransferase [Mucilaginibacter rivuli]